MQRAKFLLAVAAIASSAVVACTGSHSRHALTTSAPMSADRFAMNTEDYDHIAENDFLAVADQPLSTFSVDVDTAAYSNVRRFLNSGRLPPVDAVRTEELINYFTYAYPQPETDKPFSVVHEVGLAPWNQKHALVHIGLQGRHIANDRLPPRNLVFLLDVSGSMATANKLGLLKRAFKLLVGQLGERDRVSIVVYAGASGVILEPTPGSDKATIMGALDQLSAGGSTNGGAGIELAYALAQRNFDPQAINRVILATDGDFNVGTSDRGSLMRLIEDKRKSGVYLTVLGFGMGNLKDSTMEQLADKGNGNYAYIDSYQEAKKVLGEQAGATLVTIAEDVKIQVEFNPAHVASYRLIGYENRLLENQDFNDDSKDAGDIGAGHTVTALYEVVPVGDAAIEPKVDALKYQNERELSNAASSAELMTVKLRYKEPGHSKSQMISTTIMADTSADTSNAFRFSAAVAGFAMLLRDSKHRGELAFDDIIELSSSALGKDESGRRAQFVELVRTAAKLKATNTAALAR